MLEARDAESQERKESHGGQGCLLQPVPPDFYAVYSTTGVLRGLCSMQVGGQLHGQSCLPWHSSTHSQRQSGDTLAAGITCLLPAGPCISSHVSASSLKPDSRSPSKLEEALSPIFSHPAMGSSLPDGGGSSSYCTCISLDHGPSPKASVTKAGISQCKTLCWSLRYGHEIQHSAKAASLAGTLLQFQPQSSPKQLELTCKCLSVMEGISCASLSSCSLKNGRVRAEKTL